MAKGIDEDPVVGAKRFLDSTKDTVTPLPQSRLASTKGVRTGDIELPNRSGVTDPRLTNRMEQPRGIASNVRLRRSLLGGRR